MLPFKISPTAEKPFCPGHGAYNAASTSYFSKNPNIALSREQLLSKIWGYDFYGDDRTVDTHIKTLRNNLGKYRDLITTVRGMGYKFAINE